MGINLSTVDPNSLKFDGKVYNYLLTIYVLEENRLNPHIGDIITSCISLAYPLFKFYFRTKLQRSEGR